MKKEQLQKVLEDISRVKMAVLGDFCLDAYWFIDESKSEVSVETGQATRSVHQQKYSPGGAGNVTNNLAAIGVKDIRAFGVIGTDPFGEEMLRIMRLAGIKTHNLLVQREAWSTHTYSKPYIGDRELNRIDFGNYNVLSNETADRLMAGLAGEIPEVDVVLINQQVPSGIHTGYFKQELLGLIRRFPEKMFIVDSRNFNDFYDGAIRKMNDTEAARLCGLNKQPDEVVAYSELVACAGELFKRFRKPLFITRGERGSLTVSEKGISDIPGLMIISRVDTVGAGDSYLAGAAAALAAGYDLDLAARIGSYVAGVTVQKLFQTGTASPEEIIAIGSDPDYLYAPELAENIRRANYLPGTEIELINPWVEKRPVEHAIFDHDGTISTLREGWEHIMGPMMVKAILGNKFSDADEALYQKVRERVNDYIDKTTGIQTLVQMKGLLDMIREFGCVPEEEMLDEFGYKTIYNDELLQMVNRRLAKYEKGELSLDDFTVKNAVPFLQKLRDSGVKLYLASGTDEEDVKNEARTMGYDHLFEGRIYGAVGDVTKEAKKMVLDRILETIGDAACKTLLTFGDGPVEIRETRKRGGLAVGVASDELKRFGLNESKRTRLIKAGADLVIPDFSQSENLLNLLTR
ncbi:PfkB family carbohydrate kinase [Gaoshiqia sp. Z1-71]|uniref:PfkB family carbohydrate kinase n=1 Tax=Gaoshiqia hydrogeniformans TaxID=3290090 RepID=UPI003BF8CB79